MRSYQLSDAPRLTLYVLVAVWLTRRVYKSIPAWAKGTTTSNNQNQKDANDDLASPTVIIQKLRKVMQLCSDKVDDDLPWYKLYACFLSYVHLQRELQAAHPDFKNERYSEGDDVSTEELQELAQYCQFAKWAYLENYLDLHAALKVAGYDLVRHDTATEPGRVGHFVCVNHDSKLAIISIKGTSSFSDALTDVLGHAIDHELHSTLNGTTSIQSIRVHEGMYVAANMICDDTLHLIENFFFPGGYKVLIVGHSLGAGVACLLTLFLQCRVESANYENLRCLAYATPACLDFETAKAVAPFTVSTVNNTDCVPRLSVMNLVTLNKLFVKVDEKLQEYGRSPSSWRASKAYFSDLMKLDDDLLMSPTELHDFELQIVQDMKQDENEHSLFVPGRTVVLWQSSDGIHARAGHGGLNVLRHIEVETTMLSDHSCTNYLTNLSALVEQREQTI